MTPSAPPPAVRWTDLALVGTGLLALLLLSALTALGPPAAWKTPASLTIASAKVGLIAWYFMHLRSRPGLVRMFAAAGLVWLGILALLLSADYLTR